MGKSPPLPLEEAQARLIALATPLPVERVDIDGAIGRYLAEPLHARRTQPAADLSAMDGYAVRADDLAGPWQVIGESAAGHPFVGSVHAGQAVRIATGALLPADAACVILQEDMAREDARITLQGDLPVPPAKHVRPRAMDFAQGAPLLAQGTRIGPAQAALALAAGHVHLPVRRPVKVAIIDSGDELAADPECCAAHEIPASNGAMLLGMVNALPCTARRAGPVADNIDALCAALGDADEADVIVTSGGASVGDHDLIRPALEAIGAQIDFWRVAIKPGKPILVATRKREHGRQIILGLPGNPVSSHVTAYFFLLPLLRALLGASQPMAGAFVSSLAASLPANGARRQFLRGTWDGRTVIAHPVQDSGALAALAASNVLIDRLAGASPAKVGEEVRLYLLQGGGIS